MKGDFFSNDAPLDLDLDLDLDETSSLACAEVGDAAWSPRGRAIGRCCSRCSSIETLRETRRRFGSLEGEKISTPSFLARFLYRSLLSLLCPSFSLSPLRLFPSPSFRGRARGAISQQGQALVEWPPFCEMEKETKGRRRSFLFSLSILGFAFFSSSLFFLLGSHFSLSLSLSLSPTPSLSRLLLVMRTSKNLTK